MTEELNEDFANLQGWDVLVESRQYRAGGIRKINLREVSDFAFLDLIGLFILHSEYELAPVAAIYSSKTMSFRNFNKSRLSGTDLYGSLNIISNPDSAFSKNISQTPDADAILRQKLKLHLPTVKRYLDTIADGSITPADASTLLLRLEKQLNITNSQLRSIRRLAQEWPALNVMQRELVVARMLQHYKKFARRSEIAEFLSDLGKSKGYDLKGPIDAELANLGMGPKDAKGGSTGWLAAAAPLLSFYAGYKLIRNDKDK